MGMLPYMRRSSVLNAGSERPQESRKIPESEGLTNFSLFFIKLLQTGKCCAIIQLAVANQWGNSAVATPSL